MQKYFLDYRGGLKGDFFANYFNFGDIFIEGEYSRSISKGINLKFIDNIADLNHVLEKKILNSNQKIIPGHYLDKLNKNFLDKTNRKILKIKIEKKFYKTAALEWFCKYLLQIPTNFEKMQQLKKQDYINFKKDIFYRLDVELLKENIKINDTNRFTFLENNIQKILETKYQTFESINADYDCVFKTLNYGDIFINQEYNDLYEIFPDFDYKNYNLLLKKTWLPETIQVFGHKLNLEKYGYFDFTE